MTVISENEKRKSFLWLLKMKKKICTLMVTVILYSVMHAMNLN